MNKSIIKLNKKIIFRLTLITVCIIIWSRQGESSTVLRANDKKEEDGMLKKLVALVLAVALALCAGAGALAEEQEQWLIGFANIAEEVELQITVRESMIAAAEERGVELVIANNEYDGAKAVQNADDMITRGVDGFIEFNIDESVGPVIMEKMNEAGIPVIAVDIPMEGAAFFGANNVEAGRIAGVRLGEVSQSRWGGEPDCLLLVEDSTSGETVLNRVTQMPTGMREVFPDFSEDKVFYIDSGTDAANCQKMVSDFLMANPDYTKIAIGAFNDVIAVATLAAIETAGREEHCIMVAENEYGYLDYLKANPDRAEEDEVWVGGVAFFFNRYGDYTINAMVDVLEGGEMPENIYVEHEVVTRANAQELFGDYLAE